MRAGLWALAAVVSAEDVVADAEVSGGMDYPGADAGLVIDPPRIARGELDGYELSPAEQRVAEGADQWGVPDAGIYFEWALASRKGRYYALPKPAIVQLEKLDMLLEKSGVSLSENVEDPAAASASTEEGGDNAAPVAAPSRKLGNGDSVISAANSAANSVADTVANGAADAVANGVADSGEGVLLHQNSISEIANAISNSMANVGQAVGSAVGVTSTRPPPINQAMLGLLSILQGLQKLALAVGSINSEAM